MEGEQVYIGIGYLVGGLVGLCVWIYAIASWGLLFGLMFGWIPAMIAAGISGVLWPLIVIAVLFVGYMLAKS
jgi:hypothetical protein